MKIEFTVFTPTYNRAHTLIASYEALCRQTEKAFVWLIVDDGSTDNTRELVGRWQFENKITIQYVWQENAGKQRAVNTGVKACTTKFFGFLDSDDYYCDDTVERFLYALHSIEDNPKVAGIMARRGEEKDTPIGSDKLPAGRWIANFDDLIKRYRFYGDTCRAYKTTVLMNYLYPEIDDKFILESVMLSAIDQEYDLFVINEVFSISTYRSDGYTKNSSALYRKNPVGYALGIGQLTISNRGFLRRIKYTIMFSVWCKKHKIKNPYEMIKNKRLYLLLYPIAILAYLFKYPKEYFGDES